MQITSTSGAPLLPHSRKGYDIEFQDVHFSYRSDAPILRGVSFSVPAGSSCALVGTSGSGKSTLLRLLFRFYDPSSGCVSVNGHDVRDWDLESLRHPVGAVPQDVVLFNDTVLYNIEYGRPGASRADVEAAAQAAALHTAIEAMPDGYSTIVGERGLKLSGGEKQRLALARAFLKVRPCAFHCCVLSVLQSAYARLGGRQLDLVIIGPVYENLHHCMQAPGILLFDEATSALDATTEREVLSTLTSLAAGRTALFIAHRLSTAAQCDKIVVLERGRVCEAGSHMELLQAGGKYAQLWAQQATVDAMDALDRSCVGRGDISKA